ncbi:MAG: 30S ribosomal protein S3 [Leptospiraceae bacterium]|nr:30S ribosomal protein S3 [Leptospiraceae bacterium]MCB1202041.1 30S ribosomal protein S3 [Leptospiraceae bacterium]
MGQKVHPIGLRLKINRSWDSIWYHKKENYAKVLHEDLQIRNLISKKYRKSGVIRVVIDRFPEKIHVKLHSTKPGMVIGPRGKSIEALKVELAKLVSKPLEVKIIEVAKPDGSAQALAETVAIQLEERMAFRRAMKQALRSAIRSGAQGVRIMVSGRLNGADMARTEQYLEGRVPLHTLRALIDYGFAEADTTYGKIGVKVWVYNGDYLEAKESEEDRYTVKRRES